MDKNTLNVLRKEAKSYYQIAKKRFEEDDNIEDMHDMNTWKTVVLWLEYFKKAEVRARKK